MGNEANGWLPQKDLILAVTDIGMGREGQVSGCEVCFGLVSLPTTFRGKGRSVVVRSGGRRGGLSCGLRGDERRGRGDNIWWSGKAVRQFN